MDLFLSWSTDRSKELASIFNKWVKKVIPQLDVYYSPNDIQPGERWSDSIKDGLKGNPMGIFFVVEENIVQPWLNFEAGAISNQVGNTNVIPLLHDLEPSRITGPLTQFQAISYTKEDLKRLIRLININITDVRKIDPSILDEIFEKWYPGFEKHYDKFKQEYPSPEVKEVSGTLDNDGQLSEILSILRSMERNSSNQYVLDQAIKRNKNVVHYEKTLFENCQRYKILVESNELKSDEFIDIVKNWAGLIQNKINIEKIGLTRDGRHFVNLKSPLGIEELIEEFQFTMPFESETRVIKLK